jgi:hypothetical protein
MIWALRRDGARLIDARRARDCSERVAERPAQSRTEVARHVERLKRLENDSISRARQLLWSGIHRSVRLARQLEAAPIHVTTPAVCVRIASQLIPGVELGFA